MIPLRLRVQIRKITERGEIFKASKSGKLEGKNYPERNESEYNYRSVFQQCLNSICVAYCKSLYFAAGICTRRIKELRVGNINMRYAQVLTGLVR